MNWLEQLLSPAVVRALGWTLVHSLWQGAVVALALATLLLLLRQHTARIRYRVAGVALIALLGLSTVTFGRYYLAAEPEAVVSPATMAVPSITTSNTSLGGNLPVVTAFARQAAPAVASAPAAIEQATPSSASSAWLPYFDQYLPLLVTAWLLGLLAMTLRFLGGLAYLDRLRHYRVRQLPAEWQRRLTALSNRAGLSRPITLLESALVKAPLVAGHLRPVILLPLGTISGLSQAHLEAILAHELAHIIRRDYLMNLIQSITEILFFYHPGVWFVNACLRTERENCCDDMAIALCGSPLTVAQALTSLAELGHDRTPVPRLAVAAVGPDGSLLSRVQRLVRRRTAPSFSEGFMAALVVLGGVVLLGVSTAFSMANPHPRADRQKALVMGNAWRADLLPGLTTLPLPKLAPLGPIRPELASASDDDDKDKNKKRRRKDDNRVVILQDGARGRRDAGTVVLERDKKGRVTELYVDGNRIDAKELDEARKKSKDGSTQVIQLNSGRTLRASGRSDSRFDFDFDANNSGLTEKEQDDLRRSSQTLRVDSNKMRRAMAQGKYTIVQSGDDLKLRGQALRSAEQALRTAEQRADSEAEREKIRQNIEAVRQEHEQVREQQQAARELQQLERERKQVERERLQVEREKVRAEREAQVHKAEDAIIDELMKDGLIKDKSHFKFVLTANDLHVNEQKQSEAVFAKYLKMYEQGVGRTIGATGTVTLSYNGGNVNRIYMSRSSNDSNMPAPPAPPAAPAAPSVPAPPAVPSPAAAPAPPRAPAAPRAPRAPRVTMVNSVNLGNHLREDGLIGANEKKYRFQLDSSGLVVNGKRQSDELAAKYRQLVGHDDGKKHSINIEIEE
jgi:Zn-dependent protease with chaperone function